MPITSALTAADIQAQREARRKETRNRARDARKIPGVADDRHKVRDALRAKHALTFISIDGEGIGDGLDHRYVLLGCGDQQIENPDGLGLNEILTFLYGQYLDNPGAVFVGFYLGYDFNQWIKTLPKNRAEMLLTKAGRVSRERKTAPQLGPFPVRWNGWEFDILGMKRFKFRPEGSKGYMYINDAGPFFQASLMSVINPSEWREPVVSQEEWEILKTGKAKRDSAILDDAMRKYNRLENEILSRLMMRLNEGLTSAHILLDKRRWFGPGPAAQAWMQLQDTPTRTELDSLIPGQALTDVRGTYYGGWFEIFAHGHIPGITWEYDINSAYPSVAAKLPCLRHGKWQHRNRDGKNRTYKANSSSDTPSDEKWIRDRNHPVNPLPVDSLPKLRAGQWRFVYAHVQGSDPYIGAMSHRDQSDGMSIFHPHRTTGWFWQHELEAAQRAGLIDTIECLEWWTYTGCDCKPPLRGLAGLYDARLRVGKDTAQGKAYKLVYNSLYGKTAQSIGNPKFANMIYASLITAGCRTQILDAISTHPGGTSAVVMIATDAVYFTSPHPGLVISENLGEWGSKEKVNLTLFKPGVYWDDKARQQIKNRETVKFKSRGVNAAAFAGKIADIDDDFRAWNGQYPRTDDDWPRAPFTVGFAMTTCLQALQRGKWRLAGALGHEPRADCEGCSGAHVTHYANPGVKGEGKRAGGYFDGQIYRSYPRDLPLDSNGKWERSYQWHEGMSVNETHADDQLTDEGSVSFILTETIMR